MKYNAFYRLSLKSEVFLGGTLYEMIKINELPSDTYNFNINVKIYYNKVYELSAV